MSCWEWITFLFRSLTFCDWTTASALSETSLVEITPADADVLCRPITAEVATNVLEPSVCQRLVVWPGLGFSRMVTISPEGPPLSGIPVEDVSSVTGEAEALLLALPSRWAWQTSGTESTPVGEFLPTDDGGSLTETDAKLFTLFRPSSSTSFLISLAAELATLTLPPWGSIPPAAALRLTVVLWLPGLHTGGSLDFPSGSGVVLNGAEWWAGL